MSTRLPWVLGKVTAPVEKQFGPSAVYGKSDFVLTAPDFEGSAVFDSSIFFLFSISSLFCVFGIPRGVRVSSLLPGEEEGDAGEDPGVLLVALGDGHVHVYEMLLPGGGVVDGHAHRVARLVQGEAVRVRVVELDEGQLQRGAARHLRRRGVHLTRGGGTSGVVFGGGCGLGWWLQQNDKDREG